jgi:hypothetical protein
MKSILLERAEPEGPTRSGLAGPAEAHRPGEATARPAAPPPILACVRASGSGAPRPIKGREPPHARLP